MSGRVISRCRGGSGLAGLVVALVVAAPVVAAPARADVVYSAPCPPGALSDPSHQGPSCRPWPCESDAACTSMPWLEGYTCAERRVCTRAFQVEQWNRMTGASVVTEQSLVTTTCAPDDVGDCHHEDWPDVPTIGEPSGPETCVIGRFCVPSELPSLPPTATPPDTSAPSATPAPAPTSSPTSSPTTSPAPTPTTSAPGPSSRGCGCRVTSTTGASRSLASGLVLGLVIVVASRRRHGRRATSITPDPARVRASVALSLSAALLVSIVVSMVPRTSRAQALAPGWRRVAIEAPNTFAITALSCTSSQVYARNREGVVFAWDGVSPRWSRFPSPSSPREATSGESMWVSRDGEIVLDVGARLVRWDHHAWVELAIDPRLRGIGAIGGWGTRPWILAGRAIGTHVGDDDHGPLGAYGVAGAWWGLHDLLVRGPSEVWVASDAGVLRWDGQAWSHEGPRGVVVGLTAFAADDVWAWGPGRVIHWDGHAWTARDEGLEACGAEWVERNPFGSTLDLGGRGDTVIATSFEAICRWDGARWIRVMDSSAAASPMHRFGEVCATDRVLVVAESGNALVLDLTR